MIKALIIVLIIFASINAISIASIVWLQKNNDKLIDDKTNNKR